MASCIVRPVVPGDLDALSAMCAEHARFERTDFVAEGKAEALANALFGPVPRLHAWVAEEDGCAVGYATASHEFATWAAAEFVHMDCLFVREGRRNGGIGAALLAAVAAHACAAGIAQMQWQTPDWNRAAARFYQRAGARECIKRRFTLEL